MSLHTSVTLVLLAVVLIQNGRRMLEGAVWAWEHRPWR